MPMPFKDVSTSSILPVRRKITLELEIDSPITNIGNILKKVLVEIVSDTLMLNESSRSEN